MRTIKFRGKTTKGAWLYGDLEHLVDDGTKMTYIFDDVLRHPRQSRTTFEKGGLK